MSILHIGYLGSALVFAVLIAIPAFGYRFVSWNPVACFWAAYTVTRLLGASLADWLGRPTADGGLGIGSGLVGAILALAMVAVMAVLSTRSVRSGTRHGRGRGGWGR